MWIGCKQQRNTKRIVTRVGATVEVVTQDDNDDDEVMIQRSDAARESDVRAQPLNNGCVMSCDVVRYPGGAGRRRMRRDVDLVALV